MATYCRRKTSVWCVGLHLLIFTVLANASKLIHNEISENYDTASDKSINHSSNNESNTSSRNNNKNDNTQNGDEQMPVNDQISLLSKRLEILTEHRQEDYRMLERSLHLYVQKHLHEYINVDIKKELKDLR